MRYRFYFEKDRAMVKDTNFGLMIWDKKSKGTLNNIKNMSAAKKKFFVILDGKIKTDEEIDKLLSVSSTIRRKPK